MKNILKKKSLIVIFLVLAIVLITYIQYRSYIYTAADPENSEKSTFIVKKGNPAEQVGIDLEDKELIKSNIAFYYYVKFHNLDEKILPGRFKLSPNMTVPEILADLTDPSKAESVITIIEGEKISDIDTKLADLGLINKSEFLTAVKNFDGWQYYTFLNPEELKKLDLPLEGYLYPDTYFLDPSNFKPNSLIYKALDNFEKKTEELRASQMLRSDQMGARSFHEIVTMASIIEREVFGKDNRKIVSGILWKRLESGWRLDADATLLYITGKKSITSADLEIDSPYNTRKSGGLPPGPISNPSIDSLEAALSPKNTNYWFYLTRLDNGEVIYARTNEEQNVNREKYL